MIPLPRRVRAAISRSEKAVGRTLGEAADRLRPVEKATQRAVADTTRSAREAASAVGSRAYRTAQTTFEAGRHVGAAADRAASFSVQAAARGADVAERAAGRAVEGSKAVVIAARDRVAEPAGTAVAAYLPGRIGREARRQVRETYERNVYGDIPESGWRRKVGLTAAMVAAVAGPPTRSREVVADLVSALPGAGAVAGYALQGGIIGDDLAGNALSRRIGQTVRAKTRGGIRFGRPNLGAAGPAPRNIFRRD